MASFFYTFPEKERVMVTWEQIVAFEQKVRNWAKASKLPNAQEIAEGILAWTENAKDWLTLKDLERAEAAFNNALGDAREQHVCTNG
ncbi:MAG: hypothetical protein AAB605_02085 [Patescibacteria group bacterium]